MHPSPATLASSVAVAWRGRGDVSTSPATTVDPSAAPPASRSTCKPLRPQIAPPANRSACKPPRPRIRTTTHCRRATPPHPRKQHRSRDIPLLSGGVAEGRGGRPATAVRPLPTPPAPSPPFCPKELSLTRRVDGVRVDDGAARFLRKSLPKINNSPLNS